MKKKETLICSFVVFLLFSALSVPYAPAQEEDAFTLEEVTVTAERRSMSAQKMPVSMVVTTDNDLRANGIIDISDMVGILPSLTFYDHGNGSFTNIRGIGLNEAAPNQTNGVAYHLDGANIPREFTLNDAFFDLERVEVLRGPQGTYVGQNATGGAIFMVTRSPNMDSVEGYASATFGDYNYKLYEGAVSMPLSEALAFRISIQSEDRDSFYNNLGPLGEATLDKNMSDPAIIDRHLGRFQLKYQPSDEFDVRLLYQNSSRNTNYVPRLFNTDERWADPWTVSYDVKQIGSDDYDRFTAIVNWQAADAFAVRFTGSYMDLEHNLITDDDGTSPWVDPDVRQVTRAIHVLGDYYTGELNLISTTDSKFSWTAGIAYLEYEEDSTWQRPDRGYTVGPDWNSGLCFLMLTGRKNYGIFGEIGYQFTPTLDLKVGVRYNNDKTSLFEGSYAKIGGPNSDVIIPYHNEPEFDDMTGRIVLNWEPAANHLLYMSVARGYKPGGWESSGRVYDSETVLNKEIGWKASFLNRRLMTSLSIFHMDYNGFQATYAVDIDDPNSNTTNNIDDSTSMGVDFQMQALFHRFEFGLNGSYLDTEYGDAYIVMLPDTLGPGDPAEATVINLGGRQMDWAPELSGNIYLKYTFELGSGAVLEPRVTWRYQDDVYTSFFQAEHHRIPSYSVGDFRMKYSPRGDFYVEGYIKNFTDELYISNSGGSYPGTIYFGAPRQVGITVRYEF